MISLRVNSDRGRWTVRAAAVLVAAGSLTGVAASLSAAHAGPAVTKKWQVVQVVNRHPVGKMLAKKAGGLSLYYLPSGTCRAQCLSVWPPFVMPKGSTATPTGVTCLGTATFAHLRQITYRGHRLYTFASDSGTSVSGNGVGGFLAASVTTGACPH